MVFRPDGSPQAIAEMSDIRVRACRAELYESLKAKINGSPLEARVREIVGRHLGEWEGGLGKVLGGTTLSTIQGLIFLVFAPLVGIHIGLGRYVLVAITVFLVSFALTALGFAIAWPMDSNQAFHAIINLFLIPLWLLSGALFPFSGASTWLRLLMQINPLTYGVEALRQLLYPETGGTLFESMATLLLFALFMFGLAFLVANRRSTKPAA